MRDSSGLSSLKQRVAVQGVLSSSVALLPTGLQTSLPFRKVEVAVSVFNEVSMLFTSHAGNCSGSMHLAVRSKSFGVP